MAQRQGIFQPFRGAQARRWGPLVLVACVPACLLGFDSEGLNGDGAGSPAGDAGQGGQAAAGSGAGGGRQGEGGTSGGGAPSGSAGTGGGGASGSGSGGGSGASGGEGCERTRPEVCLPEALDDAENCCALGRSCQGGSCLAGECSAVKAAASASAKDEEVLDVVVAAGKIYWTSGFGSKLYMSPVGGGPVFTHATSNEVGERYITRVAADATHVYYTNFGSGRIARVPLEGGAIEVVAELSGEPKPAAGFGQITVAGGYAFWSMENTGGVYAASLASLPAEPQRLDPGFSRGIATDDTHVYWGTENSTIVRLPLADLSAGAQLVVEAQGTLRDVEVAGDRVYWANFESVNSADKNGVNRLVVPLYQNGPTIPFGIASDGVHVYITTAGLASESERGTLYRIPLLGGPPVELAATQTFGDMRAVVLDCNTIYLANNGDGNVLKLTR